MIECPECGNNDQSQFMGHEVQFVYDGVLFWVCRACGDAFPREFEGMGLREATSRRYAADYNRAQKPSTA